MKIVSVRGTNGAGKTSVVSAFVRTEPVVLLKNEQCIVHGHYDEQRGTVVVGKYMDGTCGGCDTVRSQDAVCATIREVAQQMKPRVLLFEGVLVSELFGRYLDLDRELSRSYGAETTWAFLVPAFDTCVERIRARSKKVYEGEALEKLRYNAGRKYEAVKRVRQKARAVDLRVLDLPTDSVENAVSTLSKYVGLHA